MRLLCLFFVLSLISSCQQETKAPASSADAISAAATQVPGNGSDFNFDKKKDESCDTEEDLEKQIEKAKKKKEAFKLQGNDGGCSAD